MLRFSFVACLLTLAAVRVEAQTVLSEDFEGVVSATLSGDSDVLNPSAIYPNDSRNTQVLSLQQGQNASHGVAWFPERVPLAGHRTQIDFDMWIRHADLKHAGEGLSAVLQFDGDLSAVGDGGGRLGTCNFPSEYVSVAFDTIDQGAADPETWCDAATSPRTCHVEINQNNCPGAENSIRTNMTFGVEAPDFVRAGDRLIPVHVTMIIEDGVLDVHLFTTADPAFSTGRVQVLSAGLELLEKDWALFGFIGTSSAAHNAHLEIDNLRITAVEDVEEAGGVLALGRRHRPLGKAQLVPRRGTLFVDDVSEGGVDGVRVDIAANESPRVTRNGVAVEALSLTHEGFDPTRSTNSRFLLLRGADEERIAQLHMEDQPEGFDTSFSILDPRVRESDVEFFAGKERVQSAPASGFQLSHGFETVKVIDLRPTGKDLWVLSIGTSDPWTVRSPNQRLPFRADRMDLIIEGQDVPQFLDLTTHVRPFSILSESQQSDDGKVQVATTGSARVSSVDALLIINNIGSSGEDGVRFVPVEALPIASLDLDPVEPGPCGGPSFPGINFCGVGQDPSGRRVELGSMNFTSDQEQVHIGLLLPAVQAAREARATARRRGVTLAVQDIGTKPMSLPKDAWPSRLEIDTSDGLKFVAKFRKPVEVEMQRGRRILIDELCIEPERPVAPGSLVAETCVQFICVDPIRIEPQFEAPPFFNIDLRADAIEVTQAIQDLNNKVPLVDGKPTYVRFHVSSAEEEYVSTATLHLESGNQEALVYPINGFLGHLTVRENPNREDVNHSFLFRVPSNFLDGNVTFTATVNPDLDWPISQPFEANKGNNDISVQKSFVQVPEMDLVVYRMGYENQFSSTNVPIGSDVWTPQWQLNMLKDYLHRTYPVSDINWIQRNWYYTGTLPDDGRPVNSALGFVRLVNQIRAQSGTNWFPLDAHYYATASDRGKFMRGWGRSNPPVSSGPSGTSRWADPGSSSYWDEDGCYTDWYGAHELGHTYRRGHPVPGSGSCGHSASDANFPHALARISTAHSGSQELMGFDIGTREVYHSNWSDFMSYCDDQWISDYTYEGLMLQMIIDENDGGGAGRPANGDRMLLVGTIDGDRIESMPAFCFPDRGPIKNREPGEWSILLFDEADSLLARYPFTPSETHGGLQDPTVPPTPETETFSFEEYVPVVPGTVSYEIRGPRGLSKRFGSGLNKPEVEVLTPNGGEVFEAGEFIVLTWTADDADGDDLAATVEFSPDGKQWLAVRGGAPERIQSKGKESRVFNVGDLPPGRNCFFRVSVSDGLNTTRDTSDAAFRIVEAAPLLEILAPLAPQTICPLDIVELKARGSDASGQDLDEEIRWVSSLDGVLGNGSTLAVHGLSQGIHQIQAMVDYSNGQVVRDAAAITVVDNPLLIRTIASTLRAEPSKVSWVLPAGAASSEIRIFNPNPEEALRYSVVGQSDWISTSDTGGTTEDQLRLQLNDTDFEPGTHEGHVDLFSPDTGSRVRVEVELIVRRAPTIDPPVETALFLRGDTNDDAKLDIADPVSTLGCLFLGQACPNCPDAADINDSGTIDISDAVYSLNFSFLGGPAPADPFPRCGADPTRDSLSECLAASCQ